MTITFRYKASERPQGLPVKTPLIPVTLCGKNSLDVVGLLDSGADISAIPLKFAKLAGLDLDGEKKSALGIGGKVEAINTSGTIIVQKGHERHSFTLPLKVIFTDDAIPVLLGRRGFFEHFKITFEESDEKVSLKAVA